LYQDSRARGEQGYTRWVVEDYTKRDVKELGRWGKKDYTIKIVKSVGKEKAYSGEGRLLPGLRL